MGCGTCGTGKPGGCQSNGSCGTGSCNRLNTYDWLRNLPISDAGDICRVVEVSFNQGSRKDFYRNSSLQLFEKGELIAVEGVNGFDVGEVSLTGEVVRLQLKKKGIPEAAADMRRILRVATDKDIETWKATKTRERAALVRSRAIAKQLNLNMKMSEVEFQADGKKATFFYIADDRVDFRELIRIYASEFKVKVEMRQIGARQESAKVGGIGSCGRELCCATWLQDFKSVNTAAARYQNLSINQTKLSGQCGRLKCCLNYELDTYLDALQGFPENADMLQVSRGMATLIKKDIFKNLMWYVLPDSNKQYPLTIERVRKIKSLNSQNIIPEDLEPVEVVSHKPQEVEPEFVDVVGHISLKSLEKGDKKRHFKNKDNQQHQQQGNQQRPQVQRSNTQAPRPTAGGIKPLPQQQHKPATPQGQQGGKNQARPQNPKAQQAAPPKSNQPPQERGNGPRPPKASQNPQQPPRNSNRPQQPGGPQRLARKPFTDDADKKPDGA